MTVGSTYRFVDIWRHQMHDDEGTASATPAPYRLPEVSGGGQAMADGQHPVARPQTARLLRPLRRRADRIARPARVRIRRRKPCTLWRRRLFGWYVRLLTSSSPGALRESVHNRVARRKRRQSAEQLAPPARAGDPYDITREHLEGSGRGHAAPVEPVSTCQRYAAPVHRVNSSASRGQDRPNRRSSQRVRDIFERHAGRTTKPVENRLPDRPAVVSVRTPGTLKKWTSALNSALAHPAHTLWTKVWIGISEPTRRNSCGLDLRTDVSNEGSARRTWSQQQRTAENWMCCGPQSWTVWLPTSASGWPRANR